MRHMFFDGYRISKTGEKKFKLCLPSGFRTFTKDPLKTLNRIGHLFYFRAEYLKERGIIDNLGLVELQGWRKKYGKLTKACILDIK